VSLETNEILGAIAVGIGATAVMDLWNLGLRRAFGIPSLDLCLLGRWIGHLKAGRFRHERIAAAAPRRHECASGVIAHYGIGAAFALALVVATAGEWLARPALVPALLFGGITVVFPYFLLQPALGLGVASARTPRPARARLKSLASHAAFGVGLYLAALALRLAFASGA
jgi:hypothetical protein